MAYVISDYERALVRLADLYLGRPIIGWAAGDGSPNPFWQAGLVPVFDPPLTTEEQADLAYIRRLARAKIMGISLEEWKALAPVLDEVRNLRQRTPAEWTAMTAAQRDNALIQWCQDITDILRAIFRD